MHNHPKHTENTVIIQNKHATGKNITTNINNYPFASESRVFFIHYHPSHQHVENIFKSIFIEKKKPISECVLYVQTQTYP